MLGQDVIEDNAQNAVIQALLWVMMPGNEYKNSYTHSTCLIKYIISDNQEH